MRSYRVQLGGFESWLWAGEGELTSHQSSWTQQPGHWILFFFEHDGIFSINNREMPFVAGNLGLVTPGTKAGFSRVGAGTHQISLSFGLTARTETVAIPAVIDLGSDVNFRRREVRAALDWMQISIMPCLAFAYNVLWSAAKPIEVFRKSDLVFDAEAIIVRRIADKINIREMANELAVSHSHLLRLFREEHGCTIQEYVREKRVEIARHLITATSQELKEIALRTGMPDLQYFNKVIRTSTGLSPRALRNQALGKTLH